MHRANLEQHFLALGRGIRYLSRNWVRHHSIKIQKTLFVHECSAKSYVFKKMIWIKPTLGHLCIKRKNMLYLYSTVHNYFTIKLTPNRPQIDPNGPLTDPRNKNQLPKNEISETILSHCSHISNSYIILQIRIFLISW